MEVQYIMWSYVKYFYKNAEDYNNTFMYDEYMMIFIDENQKSWFFLK